MYVKLIEEFLTTYFMLNHLIYLMIHFCIINSLSFLFRLLRNENIFDW